MSDTKHELKLTVTTNLNLRQRKVAHITGSQNPPHVVLLLWPKIDRVPGEGYDTPWCRTKHQVPLVSKHAKTDLRNLRISGCLRFLVVRVPNLYFGSTIQYNTVGEPD